MMNRTGAKKEVNVTLEMDWLLFDIMNETFLRGRTIQDRTNHKEVASMFASEDEENKEKILRSIKKAYGELKAELSDYLDDQNLATNNKHLDFNRDLVLKLLMPSNFNEAATTTVGDACHAYIVNQTVAEWYIVTNKSEADQYFQLANQALDSVRFASSKRARPLTPEK